MNRDTNAQSLMIGGKDYSLLAEKAIHDFWETKRKQQAASGDASNRGAVTAGKQMDGFISMLRLVAEDAGVPPQCIFTGRDDLPGYFRPSKNWDLLVVAPSGKLVAAIELKSQVGSYGNNFNNRVEEAIGSAVDLQMAFREGLYPEQPAPWVGWLMVVGDDEASARPVRSKEPHYPVGREFRGASYMDRYRIFCQKLVSEGLYASAALLRTSGAGNCGSVAEDISLRSFLSSFVAHLKGFSDEFK